MIFGEFMIKLLGRFEFEQFLEQLSIVEDDPKANHLVAICNYTSRRHDDINHGLRNQCDDPKHIKAVKLLVEALDELPISKDEFVVRWICITPEMEATYFDVGGVIYERGFISTSRNPEFKFKNNPDHHKLVIKHLNGRSIQDWSKFPSESEVLIPMNSFFQVMYYDIEEKTIYLNQITEEDVIEIGKKLKDSENVS